MKSSLKNSNLIIHPLIKDDLPLIKHLQPEDWSDILGFFNFYLNSSYCYPIKSVDASQINGVGCCIYNGTTGWLAHIIVDKNYRNQGIGTRITQRLIDILISKKCETLLLIATEMGERIYKKLGFIQETKYVFLKGHTIVHKPSKQIIMYGSTFKNQVLNLDRTISGENRSHLIIPHISSSMLYSENDRITGFYIPHLGEGLIVADSNNAGNALLGIKISKDNAKIVLPMNNSSAQGFLKKNGYSIYSQCSRMISGKSIIWHPEKIFSRIGGNLG